MAPHASYYIFSGTWLCVCAFALWRGGAAPRLVAASMLAAYGILLAVGRGIQGDQLHIVALATDGLTLACCLYALKWTHRTWLLLATACEVLSVATHAAKVLDPTVHGWAYVVLGQVWGVAMLPCLIVGTFMEPRR